MLVDWLMRWWFGRSEIATQNDEDALETYIIRIPVRKLKKLHVMFDTPDDKIALHRVLELAELLGSMADADHCISVGSADGSILPQRVSLARPTEFTV